MATWPQPGDDERRLALPWPDPPVEVGRWKWAMQPVITAGSGPTPPALYVFEKNPSAMESPFPEVTSQDSSRQPFVDSDGFSNVLLLRTKYEVGQFKVSGKIWSLDQYMKMQAYYDWQGLVAIRDHFGRQFVVRLMDFDVRPVIPSKNRPYKFEYDLQCQVWYGEV